MGARENTEVFVSILNPGKSDEGLNEGGSSRNEEKGPPVYDLERYLGSGLELTRYDDGFVEMS